MQKGRKHQLAVAYC